VYDSDEMTDDEARALSEHVEKLWEKKYKKHGTRDKKKIRDLEKERERKEKIRAIEKEKQYELNLAKYREQLARDKEREGRLKELEKDEPLFWIMFKRGLLNYSLIGDPMTLKVNGNGVGKFTHKRASFISDWVDRRKLEWKEAFGNSKCKSLSATEIKKHEKRIKAMEAEAAAAKNKGGLNANLRPVR